MTLLLHCTSCIQLFVFANIIHAKSLHKVSDGGYDIIVMKLNKISVSPTVRVHPCDKENRGGCTQTCTKSGEKAECACNEGYFLENDGKTCGLFSFNSLNLWYNI